MRNDRFGLIPVVVFILFSLCLLADSGHGVALNTKTQRADDWQYLVITSETFIDSQSGDSPFDPLMDRLSAGMTAHLQTTQSIGAVPGPSNPSAAVNLRAFIQTAVAEHGTRYVLLGGDSLIIPIQFFWMPGELIGSDEDVAIPADIFYSCLDGTWDSNGNGRFGEETDHADFIPDVAVGRILAGTPGEAQNQVSKILAYENSAGPPFSALQVGDRFYYDLCGSQFLDQLPGVMAQMDIDTLYDRDGVWDPTVLLEDYLNTDTIHLVNHLGSGYWNYALKLWSVELTDGLTNSIPFFLYSQADSAGDFSRQQCWGQSITAGSPHGAFAAVLHSGPSWSILPGGDSASNDLHRAFLSELFQRFQPVESVPSRTHTLGEALVEMRKEWAGRMTDRYYRWCNCGLNLFGCPYTTLHWACTLSGVQLAPVQPAGDDFILRQGVSTTLRVAFHTACGLPVTGGTVTTTTAAGRDLITLHDDGQSPDALAGDGIFSADWTPADTGDLTLTMDGEAGIETDALVLTGTVLPNLYYYFQQIPFQWEDASDGTLILEGMDDASWTVDLGFDFPFYGRNYSALTATSNGVLFFEQPPLSSSEAVPIPSFRLPHALIACYWTDLWAPAGSGIRVKTVGSFPQRRCIIEWDRYAIWGVTATGTFQAVLEEGSGKIWLNYLDTVFDDPALNYGMTAVYGVENQEGADGRQGIRQGLQGNLVASSLDSHCSYLLRPGESPADPVVVDTCWLNVPPGSKDQLDEQEAILFVELLNSGPQTAQEVSGVLTAATGITILEGTASFGSIAPGLKSHAGFRIRFADGLGCETGVEFQLQLSFSDPANQVWNKTESLLLTAQSLVPVTTLSHQGEPDDAGFSGSTPVGTMNWQWLTGPAYSPTHVWHVEGEDGVQDSQLVSPEFTVPEQATLTFYHRYDFEPGYDGGVLEILRQGATAWTDLEQDIVRGSYTGTIATGYDSPVAGQPAWTGTTDSEFIPVQVSLVRYAGQAVHLRFRFAGDATTASGGWSIDDIEVSGTVRNCLMQPQGDVDVSPGIDATDLAWLMNASVGNSLPPGMHGGDLNGNSAWDAGDVLILADYLAGNVAFWIPSNR